jgi:glycosyltransferase involved in cell wall biosynthesis
MRCCRDCLIVKYQVSVCVPSYNRVQFLAPLLNSIANQWDDSIEVVICEDCSPEREQIRAVVEECRRRMPITYVENSETLGYDGNLRACIRAASGDYCLMMGNDDLLCEGAIAELKNVIQAYPSVGVMSRAYKIFYGSADNVRQTIIHFKESRFFPKGAESLITLYRRVAVLSGLVFRKDLADSLATDRWDGTLYYQMYLCGETILASDGFYISKPLVACRDGIAPDFGNSKSEKRFHTPGKYTNEGRLKMFGSLLDIVRDIEARHNVKLLERVVRDIGNYSYVLLHPQRRQGLIDFFRYYRRLGQLGFARCPLYHCYFVGLVFLRDDGMERLLRFVRKFVSATPRFGKVYSGVPV